MNISVPLKILQWNCTPINTTRLVDLSDYVTQNKVNIVCLQEINLHRTKRDYLCLVISAIVKTGVQLGKVVV